MTRSRLLLLTLGLALSALAIFLLVRSIDLTQAMHALERATLAPIVAGTLLTVLVYFLRAVRWRDILLPEAQPGLPRLFSATMVGFLAINTLPARLGELVRAYVLARTEKIRTATVLGSLAVERIFDLVMLGVFWGVSLVFAPVPGWFRWSGYVTVGLGILVGGLLWAVYATRGRTAAWSQHPLIARLPEPIARAVSGAIPAFGAGIQAMGHPMLLARAAGWSAVIWVTSGSVFLFVAASLHIALPYWSIFFLTFVVCVGISVPASPGFLGVMEGACVLGLSLLGTSGPVALAFAIIYHVTQIIPPLLLGGYYFITQHLTLEMVQGSRGGEVAGGRKKRRQ
ncbi:MAG: lysylphosphatidylglycerol synthase transmembrane domain-containing protein [Candidatus Eiseniibacteriota bacterium]